MPDELRLSLEKLIDGVTVGARRLDTRCRSFVLARRRGARECRNREKKLDLGRTAGSDLAAKERGKASVRSFHKSAGVITKHIPASRALAGSLRHFALNSFRGSRNHWMADR